MNDNVHKPNAAGGFFPFLELTRWCFKCFPLTDKKRQKVMVEIEFEKGKKWRRLPKCLPSSLQTGDSLIFH